MRCTMSLIQGKSSIWGRSDSVRNLVRILAVVCPLSLRWNNRFRRQAATSRMPRWGPLSSIFSSLFSRQANLYSCRNWGRRGKKGHGLADDTHSPNKLCILSQRQKTFDNVRTVNERPETLLIGVKFERETVVQPFMGNLRARTCARHDGKHRNGESTWDASVSSWPPPGEKGIRLRKRAITYPKTGQEKLVQRFFPHRPISPVTPLFRLPSRSKSPSKGAKNPLFLRAERSHGVSSL